MGIDAAQRAQLLSVGRLRRVRRGWFADAQSSDAAVRAIQLGGRLGCLSACKHWGLWVPWHEDLHVVMNPGMPMPVAPGVQFHRLQKACDTAVAPVLDSVAHVLHRHDEETGLVVLESAVNKGFLPPAEARWLLANTPLASQRTSQHFSPLAQSGSETRVRLFFQRRAVRVEPQAFIPGIGHVDVLVGKSWIIEADSREHHAAPRNVQIDCARDLKARELGYVRDRLSYEQIWLFWEETQRMLIDLLRTKRHLRPPTPLRRSA